jgi:hypothetical protein
MTTSQMHEFARLGADARLKTIQEEQQAIFSVFPELRDGAAPAPRTSTAPRGRRRRMSAAERKAVGRRMRAYWAKRRAEKSGTVKKEARTTKRKGGMSAENRKRQGERMKAYWAAKRAQKVDGAGAGTKSETAGQNGAPSSKRAGRAGRKHGRKK